MKKLCLILIIAIFAKASNWQVVNNSGIPQGMIASFYLSVCPSGWVLADGTNGTPDLRGQFIRGASSSHDPDYANRSGGIGDLNKVGSSQKDEIKSHTHTTQNYVAFGGWNSGAYYAPGGNYFAGNSGTNATGGSETRPTNISLLFCMKK